MCRLVIEFDKKEIFRVSCDGESARAVLVNDDKCKVTEVPITRDVEKVKEFFDLADMVRESKT